MYRDCKNTKWMNSLEWWQLISEKRCDGYSHSQEDDYNEALKASAQNESRDMIKKCTAVSRISNNITGICQRYNHKHRDTVIHDFY